MKKVKAKPGPTIAATTGTRIALVDCKKAWEKAYALAKENGLEENQAARVACVAYKLAMPEMDSLAAIRAAIGCIVQGITLEVFSGRDGSQLLYAAQIALSIHTEKEPKR